MSMLIAGLVIFLGVHSVRILAEGLRTQMRARLGENGYKGLYSIEVRGFDGTKAALDTVVANL